MFLEVLPDLEPLDGLDGSVNEIKLENELEAGEYDISDRADGDDVTKS